jgi:hypothetical protein
MPGLLAHCLVAMAFEGCLGRACGWPTLSWGMFAAGIIAVLVDLDDCGLRPNRTPLGHSLLSAIFAGYIITAATAIASPSGAAEMALAVSVAFGSHLALDACTKGGIFMFPRSWHFPEWLEMLPAKPLRLGGAEYVIVDEKGFVELQEGSLSWKGWRRAAFSKTHEDGSGKLNAVLCVAGLTGLVVLVIAA